MIDKHELMIGNRVQQGTVEQLKNRGAVVSGKYIDYNYIIPELLTDDHFKTYGFELHNDIWNKYKYNNLFISLELTKYDSYYQPSINDDEYNNGEIIKYVHQLQNLWLSLTQTPLISI